jgi:hypothetical protein
MTFSFCSTARFLTQLYLVQTLAGKRVAAYELRHTFENLTLPRLLTEDLLTSRLKPETYSATERKTRANTIR